MFPSGKMCAGYPFRPPLQINMWFRFVCVKAVTTYLGILCYGVTAWGELLCHCALLPVTARCRAVEP